MNNLDRISHFASEIAEYFCWKALPIALGVSLLCSAASAHYAYPVGTNYVWLEGYEYSHAPGLRVNSALGLNVGMPIDSSSFSFEWQRPFIPFVTYDDSLQESRFASTTLVMSCALALTAWSMAIGGASEEQINKSVWYVLGPFGPHLAYRPSRWATLYAGTTPDIVLFSKYDGLLMRARIGFRLDGGVGITLNGGIEKSYLWGFDVPSRDFRVGYFVGVSYFSPMGTSLLD